MEISGVQKNSVRDFMIKTARDQASARSRAVNILVGWFNLEFTLGCQVGIRVLVDQGGDQHPLCQVAITVKHRVHIGTKDIFVNRTLGIVILVIPDALDDLAQRLFVLSQVGDQVVVFVTVVVEPPLGLDYQVVLDWLLVSR